MRLTNKTNESEAEEMKQINMTYAEADAAFYEAMRINRGKSNEWSKEKEENALIDTERTVDNYELIPHHEALNPSDYRKHNRGQAIAEYHKQQTGRTARMNGSNEQKSKAVCCVITLPKTYLCIDYGLTDAEYKSVEVFVESGKKEEPDSLEYKTAIEKIRDHRFTEDEKHKIKEFFMAALKAWQKVAGIRDQDILFACVHQDESYPHLHISAMPAIEVNGKITYSTSKYNNYLTHYFDKLHTNVIEEMAKQSNIDASGLLNGATKGKGFKPADFSRELRMEGVRLATETSIIRKSKINAEHQEKIATENLLETRGQVEDERDKLILIKGQKQFEEQRYKELQEENDSMTINNTTIRQRLKDAKKNGQPREVNGYDYERFYNWKMNDLDIRIVRERLKAEEADRNAYVEAEVQKRLPIAIRTAREDREYCDKWLTQAQVLEMKEQEIIKREEVVKAIEDKFEQAVEKEVVTRLRDSVKKIFKDIIEELFKADGFIMSSMKKWMPYDIFERFDRFVRGTIDNLERAYTGSIEGQGDAIERVSVAYDDQDIMTGIEDCIENIGFEED